MYYDNYAQQMNGADEWAAYTNSATDTKQFTPITLSWNVSSFSKIKKSPIQKVKNLVRPEEEPEAYFDPDTGAYVEPPDQNFKAILKNVEGLVKPGQLCAIMGASGAGKTTLLNILNFRNQNNLITVGDVNINGYPANWDKITRYSGYVQQDDLFIGTMTVREHLTFMAMLKMGYDYTKEERLARVDEVIAELNLVKSENTLIGLGDRLKGISGGEKRRLAFASEILTNPPLLFCDEPTSGLDSFMAQTLVDSMRKLADMGKTVICTIHQPSSQTFEKFDTLCLLAEGKTAYLGPNKDAISYFASLGYRCPELYNPADFFIQTLAIKPESREASLQQVKQITDAFEYGPIQSQIRNEIANINYAASYTPEEEFDRKYSSSYLQQCRWLIWRQLRNEARNPIATKVLVIQTIIISVFLGLIFLQIKNTQTGVQDRMGVLFITLMQCNFGYIFAIVNTFPFELPLIYRETKNRLYSILPYFLIKQLVEFPKFVILPGLLVTIIYWMSGVLNRADAFFEVLGILILCTQVGAAYGTFVSVVAPSIEAALGLVVPVIMPLLIFAGFFLNNDTTPVYLIWIKYISWFYYTNELVNVQVWTKFGSIPCDIPVNTTVKCGEKCMFSNGYDVLDFNGMKPENVGRDVGILLALAFAPRFVSFFILKFKLRRN